MMSPNVGRAETLEAKKIVESVVGPPVELQIAPDDTAMKIRLKGGAGMKPATSQSRLKKLENSSTAGTLPTKQASRGVVEGATDDLPTKRTVTFSAPVLSGNGSPSAGALPPMSPLRLSATPTTAPGPPTLSPTRLSALGDTLGKLTLNSS